ncbi:MAG TPA: hypothetical protein VHZ24_10965 [Pirellulales bacterium]|jgi:hypothetical protein|nr:hypothetical protein [Pirellulales bacterium]
MTRKHHSPNRSEADDTEAEIGARHRPDELPPNARGPAGSAAGDPHAVGETMGGGPLGGLAGTNVGDGSPENADIDAAAGSGDFDARGDVAEEDAYSGHAGGAVGGSIANQRARGGRSAHGIAEDLPTHDGSTIGQNPQPRRPK